MQFKVYICQCQCLILFYLSVFTNAKALVGLNVEQVPEGDFQFIVSISEMTSSQNIRHVCAGTLVSFKHVLTAEHCLVNRNTTLIKVIVGSTYLIMGRRHSILWWIGFDHWSSQLNIRPTFMMNDIAIIKLKVRTNSSIIPATLSNYENSALFGLNVEIAGWGISNTGEVAPIMEKIKVTVLSKDECEARASILAEEELRFESVLFCSAANPFALVSNGDSGTPVIYQNIVIGVTKGSCPFPEIDIHPGKLNMHFGISYYRDFITYVIHNLN